MDLTTHQSPPRGQQASRQEPQQPKTAMPVRGSLGFKDDETLRSTTLPADIERRAKQWLAGATAEILEFEDNRHCLQRKQKKRTPTFPLDDEHACCVFHE